MTTPKNELPSDLIDVSGGNRSVAMDVNSLPEDARVVDPAFTAQQVNVMNPVAYGAATGLIAPPVVKEAVRRYNAPPPSVSGAPAGAPSAPSLSSLTPDDAGQARLIQGGTEDGLTGRARQTGYNARTATISAEQELAEKNIQKLIKQGIITGDNPLLRATNISSSTPSGIMVSPEANMPPKVAPTPAPKGIVNTAKVQVPKVINALDVIPHGTSFASQAFRGAGRTLAGAGAGFQGADAYNRFQAEDYPGAAISGIGSLGSAATLIPNPYTRVIGTGVGVGAEALNSLIDKFKRKSAEEKAEGGLVHLAGGGQPEMGEARAYEPSYSEKIRDFAAQYMSPTQADRLFGGPRAQTIDKFNPVGMVLQTPGAIADAATGFVEGAKEGNYPKAMGNYYSGVLSALPLVKPAGQVAKTATRELGPKAADMMENYLTKIGGIQHAVPPSKSTLGSSTIGEAFDPRFDKRVGEIPKLQNMTLHREQYGPKDVPNIHLPDYEGHPFITSISDRSLGGSKLKGINDVMFNEPVDLTGGKLYMYNNPGKVWAAGDVPADNIMRQARALKDFTGKDPLYVPWQMAPTGSDFSHMTGQTMLSYAQSAMPKSEKKQLDKYIKNAIPDWKGIDNPESMKQFLSAPAGVRGTVQDLMDKNFRDAGGIGIGQARLAIADPEQLIGKDGGVSHIGRIFADKSPIRNTGNASYPSGIPGEGVGKIPNDLNIYQLLTKQAEKRGVADRANPTRPDLRSIEVFPASGVLDDKTLKSLGFKKGGLATLK